MSDGTDQQGRDNDGPGAPAENGDGHGENTCSRCNGTGRIGNSVCPECNGSGKVAPIVGDN